jgi:hypothetical protein
VLGGRWATTGIPDLLVVIDGRACFLEVKRPGCKPTPLQAHRIAEIQAAGAVAEVVRSWDEAKTVLGLPG